MVNINDHAMELREKVAMPNLDFLVRVIYYEQKEAREVFSMHWHDNIELIYVISGDMTIECNGIPTVVTAGSSIVIGSNEYHSCSKASGNLSLICVLVDMSVLNSRFYDACEEKYIQPLFHNNIIFKNLIVENKQFNGYIQNIYDEYITKNIGYELSIKASLFNLLTCLLRNNLDKVFSQKKGQLRSLNLQRVNRILQYIDENYMDEVNIDEISGILKISKFYFCKVFKKMTGKTITEYVNYVRIREAVSLLRETDMSVTDISMTVGFNDINYFSRVFRSFMGKPPTSIRKEQSNINTM